MNIGARISLTIFLLLVLGAGLTYANPNKYNVLLITIDTLRPDRLSCYNEGFVKTPNIDSLADQGALFRRAYAHTPTTLPSHTNILLGTTPVYHGVHDNHNFIIGEDFLTLAEHLKSNGYATGAFVGAFPLDSRFGLTQGFDVYDDNYGMSGPQEFAYVERIAGKVVQGAVSWLAEQSSPWFLWIHCFDPHQKYDPPEPWKSEYEGHPYNGEVAYVDSAIGELLNYLGNNDLYKNTLVVFTADHGESLGEHGESTHGYFAYNSSILVPMILSYPGIKPQTIHQNVCHIDIFPTVCEILGLEKPAFLQGMSLVPTLNGKRLPERDIYFESLYPYYSRGWAPLQGFIHNQEKFFDSPIPEFYDLAKDPDELQNLAETTELNKYQKRLRELMEKQIYDGGQSAKQKITDRRTLEKLSALGYISSPQASQKESFTAEDDLKVLLPYQNQLQMSMAAYHKGNFQESENILRGILSERQDFDQAYTHLATVYKEQNKFEEAVEILREGYTNCNGSYKVITTYGIMLTDIGQYDAAIEILEQGLDILDHDPELWNYLGVAHWKKGDLDKALEAYQTSLELDKNHPIVFNNIGSTYLSKFLKTKEREVLRQAAFHFQKAIEIDPNYASAYNGLGAVYSYGGNIEGAIFCLEKAVELKPEFSAPLYNLGLAYLANGEKGKALDTLVKYKQANYSQLPTQEKNRLDSLIQKLQREQ